MAAAAAGAGAGAGAGALKTTAALERSVFGTKRPFDPAAHMLVDRVFKNYTAGAMTEVEFRLGQVVNRTTTERHKLAGMTTCAPLTDHGQKFVPGVSKAAFEQLMKTLKAHKFPSHVTNTTDTIYQDGVRRCTTTGVTIHKKRLCDLDYTNPVAMYDMRLSVSTEQKCNIPPTSSAPIVMLRRKLRTSFDVFGAWRVDMTIVTTNNKTQDVTYEVELEILGLASAIDECRAGHSQKLTNVLALSLLSIQECAKIAGSVDCVPDARDDVKETPKAAEERAKAAFQKALVALHISRDPEDPVWKAWGGKPDQLLQDT